MTTTIPEIAPGADYWPPATPAAPAAAATSARRWATPERLGLAGLLLATAVLYLWGLGASGYANDFYAAAVQAGTKSWKAFFFGSFDSSNFITVDKPPAFLWPMEVAGRIFGFSSWSMLVPQALEGIGSVWLLYLTVRRWFGASAGFIAGAVLALTPVAVLMFRFNNPDSMMTFLMVVSAYFMTRALESARTRWILLSGASIGFAFLAKGLQPFTLVPVLALVYLVAAPTTLFRRIWQTLAAGAALVASCGWWLAAVALTPAADRPYIGGSTNNSALELAFGYNGLGRLTGNEVSGGGGGAGGAARGAASGAAQTLASGGATTGGAGPTGGGGGGGGASFSGSTGIGRLFNSLMGGQISWLLPAALLAIVALVVLAGRSLRTDRTRAAAILWGGWLLVTGAVLSFASGIIHTYYTIELAPAIAALVGIGAVLLWRRRDDINARLALAVGVLISGVWSYELLQRTPSWNAWLSPVVVAATFIGVAALLIPMRWMTRSLAIAAVAGAVALGGGASAFALSTATTPHTGSIPSAGPAAANGAGLGGPGGASGPGGQSGQDGQGGQSGQGGQGGRTFGGSGSGGPGQGGGSGQRGGSSQGGSSGEGGFAGPGGGFGGPGNQTGSQSGSGSTSSGSGEAGAGPAGLGGEDTQGSQGGPGGGAGGNQTASSALVALLKATDTKWAAATIGSQTAAPLELASGKAVMALGGFNGGDNSISLAQFEKLVEAGKIRYFIGGGTAGGPGGGSSANSAISSWVASHYKSTTVGGSTVYDLSQASS